MLRPPPSATRFPYTTLFRSFGADELADRPFGAGSADGRRRPRALRGEALGLRAQPELRQPVAQHGRLQIGDRKSTRLNSSHVEISYAVFCLKKKNSTLTCHV